MSEVEFFATPGYGETQSENMHYSQAVRIGDRVEISGQGGWSDEFEFPETLEEEIVQAFENVERTLRTAGASWADVVHVNSYHVLGDDGFDEHNRIVVEQFRKWMSERKPIWTESGVTALGHPKMRIEIRVTAVTQKTS
ncbi:RidA family protein [Lentzea sp.]|uniref:RidA family protein n=1 Tax=Lentzea sp. TaxID=56099 RepID=UPI002ECFE1C6